MAACGGSSGNNGGEDGKILSVSVSCNPTLIQGGQTSKCTAGISATGKAGYTTVNWSLTAGSISDLGIFTAPPVDASSRITVTASAGGKSGSAVIMVNPPNTGSNVVPITVDAGPTNNYVNGAFASVTFCVPGTTNCQTIDHLLVDTGSSGVRILDSVLTLPLPQQTVNGNLVAECAQYADGAAWGYVAAADIGLGGQKSTTVPGASFTGVPVQAIGTSVVQVPQSCSAKGTLKESVEALGANGILGVGLYKQDCGTYCTSNLDPNFPFYYSCSGGKCSQVTLALTDQVQNPVWLLPHDNNGVLILLYDCEGCGQLNGSLILGVDTQGDNLLADTGLYTTTPDGNFQKVTLNGIDYVSNCGASSKPACLDIDSGSNALFILDATTLGVSQCSGSNSSFYCQSPDKSINPTTVGINNASNSAWISMGDADSLLSSHPAVPAFSNLAGPNPGSFDYGLPFFYLRPVFTIIEGGSTTKGVGPAWAY